MKSKRFFSMVSLVLAVANLAGSATANADVPIIFAASETGSLTDPTGLFTHEEIAAGGSVSGPSIWYANFEVDGGKVSLAILTSRWCGMRDCPFRFRLETDSGDTLTSDPPGRYGMICQDREAIFADPVDLVLSACGAEIDLKNAR